MITKRKIIRIHCFLFVVFLIMAGCSQDGAKGIKTRIKGSFPALPGKSVTLSEYDINSAIPIDTTRISENGSFKFTFRRTKPGFYLLKVDNKNYLTLILDREKDIEILSDLPDIRKNYTVKGSPDSELYREFELFLEVNREKVESLGKTYNDYQRSSRFSSVKLELDKTYQEIFSNQRQYSIRFIENHCSSLASLLVLNRRFGERKILTETDDYDYFAMVDSCLTLNYADNKHLVEFKKRLEIFKEERKIFEITENRLAPGNKIPEIGLEDPSGTRININSLAGKPFILYFWASWDQESRKANQVLKELINKTSKVKLQVYAIGLESYKDPWTAAIKADGIQHWTNVTDYLNVHSSAKTLFNIPDDLPYFFLVDKDLVIRYKGNNFDELSIEINH